MVATIRVIGAWHQRDSFSPLFVGAMVATLALQRQGIVKQSFSPLFVGAMVATERNLRLHSLNYHFQSPFRRGNGCYTNKALRDTARSATFSPLFVGAMVATACLLRGYCHRSPFSPLFVGAMVATYRWLCRYTSEEDNFQSPFHRGNGCYW